MANFGLEGRAISQRIVIFYKKLINWANLKQIIGLLSLEIATINHHISSKATTMWRQPCHEWE